MNNSELFNYDQNRIFSSVKLVQYLEVQKKKYTGYPHNFTQFYGKNYCNSGKTFRAPCLHCGIAVGIASKK